jgi:hypothetical protein
MLKLQEGTNRWYYAMVFLSFVKNKNSKFVDTLIHLGCQAH